MGLVCAIQAKVVGMDEWNHIKLDDENGRHNMMIYEGFFCHFHGVSSHVIVIPDDMELKQYLMHDYYDSSNSSYLGAYYMIGSWLSHYY